MATYAATVGGDTRYFLTWTISATQNGIDRLTATYELTAGMDWPEIDDVVSVTEDGTAVFGGTVKTVEIKSIADDATPITVARISAMDYNEIAQRRVASLTVPSGNLKAAMNAVLPYLDGVSVDPAQVDGPTMEELVYDNTRLESILQDFTNRTGYFRNISYTKVWKYFTTGDAAPWQVTDGDGNTEGDVSVTEERRDYYNQFIVKFLDLARNAYAFFRAVGGVNPGDTETVTIGSKDYTFQTVLTDVDGHVQIGATTVDTLTNLANAIILGGTPGTDYAASTTAQGSVSAAYGWTDGVTGDVFMRCTALEAGAAGNSISVAETCATAEWVTEGNVGTGTLTFGADEALTNSVTVDDLAEQALYGIYTEVVEATNVYTEASAEELGEALLAAAIIVQKTIKYRTTNTGIFPGMLQTITCVARNLSSEVCTITDVACRWEGKELVRDVTAISGSIYKGNPWRDQYKKWSGSTTGATATYGGGGGTGTSAPSLAVFGMRRDGRVLVSAAAWEPIADWVPVKLSAAFTGTVRVWAWSRTAGRTVGIRVTSGTDGITFGTVETVLLAVSSTTPTERTGLVTIETGKYYRVEVSVDADDGVGCYGYVELT